MKLKEQNVLFLTRTMKLGGTENVILQLCEIFHPLVNKIIVCSCGGINVQNLQKMGIKHYEIPDIVNRTPMTILKITSKLTHIVVKEHITTIHTHHRMAAFYISLLGLYKKRFFINTCHSTFNNKRLFTRFAYKYAKLIACGEVVKENLEDFFGLSNRHITVVRNSVKPFDGVINVDTTIQKLHEDGCFIVGNIGRLSEEKGIKYYIMAIPKVIKSHPEARFLIIGSGEDHEKLKKLVKELDIEKSIYFMGYRSDIQNLMSQLDLVVLSSLWEGFPLVPIEAFSTGKTIVATAVGGTPEIVQDGVNGYLVTATDVDALSEKICILLEQPDIRSAFQEKAKEQYEKNFSFKKLRENYIKFYEEL